MSVERAKIYPINTGWCEIDMGTYMFFKGEPGKKIQIPVLCFYVDTGEHKIMVDTGLPDAEVYRFSLEGGEARELTRDELESSGWRVETSLGGLGG